MEAIDETINLLAEQLRGCLEINDETGALDPAALPAAEWHIDGDGLLTIAPPAGREQAVLKKERDGLGRIVAPWYSRVAGIWGVLWDLLDEVRGVLVRPGVVAAGYADCLFADLENLE